MKHTKNKGRNVAPDSVSHYGEGQNLTLGSIVKGNAGFSLMELLTVLCLIGILTGMVVPSLNSIRNTMTLDYGIRQIQRDLRVAQQYAEKKNHKVIISFFTDVSPCKYVIREYGQSVYLVEGYLPNSLDERSVAAITVLPDRTFQKNGHIMLKKGNVSRYLYYYQTGRTRITREASSG